MKNRRCWTSSPISPAEALRAYTERVPGVFFDAFNECILKYWEGRSSYFAKDEILSRLADADITVSQISAIGLDNILEVYRASRWLVERDHINGVTHYHFEAPRTTTDYVKKELPDKKSKWFAWLR